MRKACVCVDVADQDSQLIRGLHLHSVTALLPASKAAFERMLQRKEVYISALG